MNKKQIKSHIKIIQNIDRILIEINDLNIRGYTCYRGEGNWEFRFEHTGTFSFTSTIYGNSEKQVLNKAISTIKNRLKDIAKNIRI